MKGSPSTDTVRWAGHAWVGPGIGIFHGRAGQQDWHHHQAHQISVGLDSPLVVETSQGIQTGSAVFIPAGLQPTERYRSVWMHCPDELATLLVNNSV